MRCAWLGVCGVLVMGACGAFASDGDDAQITARIETIFTLNEHLSPFKIDTTTKDGVVTLSGNVEDEIQKDLAGDLAASVEGVKKVENQLVATGAVAPSRPKRPWKQKVEDMTVTASVRSRLTYHREFKGLRIGVKTENNVVTLFGVVDSETRKERIGTIAFETKGVDSVVNNLTVQPQTGEGMWKEAGRRVSDEWVEKHVETALMLNRHIRLRDLNVEVNEGLCILTGTVDSDTERGLAESVARSIHGVKDVRNEIRVRVVQPEELVKPAEPAKAETLPEPKQPPVKVDPLEPVEPTP